MKCIDVNRDLLFAKKINLPISYLFFSVLNLLESKTSITSVQKIHIKEKCAIMIARCSIQMWSQSSVLLSQALGLLDEVGFYYHSFLTFRYVQF